MQKGACPPIFQQSRLHEAQQPQQRSVMERLPSVPLPGQGNSRLAGSDPDWFPSQQLTRAASEGNDANQGRCKCGESSNH